MPGQKHVYYWNVREALSMFMWPFKRIRFSVKGYHDRRTADLLRRGQAIEEKRSSWKNR